MRQFAPARRVGLSLLFLFLAFAWTDPARSHGLSPRPTLDEVVREALVHNSIIRVASRESDAARARLSQAGALEPPVLSYEAGKLGTVVTPEERETSVRLSQEVPFPSQRARSRGVASFEVALAESRQQAVELRLRADVTRSYRRLQADLLALRVLGDLRTTAADLEEMTSIRLRSGKAGYLDALRARVERVRLENEVLETERSLRTNRRAINVLLARSAEEPIEPGDSLVFVPLSDSLPALISLALETRPRMQSARLQAQRDSAAVAQAKSLSLPIAALSFGLDRVSGSSTPGFAFGVGISLPFAPWTDRHGRVAEARALEGSAEARLDAAESEVEAAVREAYGSARSAERLVGRFQSMILPDAQDAIHAAIQGYQFGQLDGLELFETLRTYRSAQLEYVRTLLNYELALTDLKTAE